MTSVSTLPRAPMTTIEVPGEPTLFRTYDIPPERVALPLELRPRQGWYLLLLTPLAIFFGFLAGVLIAGLLVSPGSLSLPLAAALLFTSVMAVLFCGPLLTGIADALRRGPVLVLREDGLIDFRSSKELVPWSAIAHVRFEYNRGGIGAVHLRLRRELPSRWNPFRAGTLGLHWRREPCTLNVPLFLLSTRAHILAHLIGELVKRAGGEVQTWPPEYVFW